MKKQTLTLDITPEFYLLALVSPLRYYRLGYSLNQCLSVDFTMKEPLAVPSGQQQQLHYFHYYEYYEPLEQLFYKLVANKSEGGTLVPELKRVDYLFMLEGEFAKDQIEPIQQQLKELSSIQAVYQIDPQSLRSWQNLLTE